MEDAKQTTPLVQYLRARELYEAAVRRLVENCRELYLETERIGGIAPVWKGPTAFDYRAFGARLKPMLEDEWEERKKAIEACLGEIHRQLTLMDGLIDEARPPSSGTGS